MPGVPVLAPALASVMPTQPAVLTVAFSRAGAGTRSSDRICTSERASSPTPDCTASVQVRGSSPVSGAASPPSPPAVLSSPSAPAVVSSPPAPPAVVSSPAPASTVSSPAPPALVSSPAPPPAESSATDSSRSSVEIGSSIPKRLRIGDASLKAVCASGMYFFSEAGVMSPRSISGMRISKKLPTGSPCASSCGKPSASSPSSMK